MNTMTDQDWQQQKSENVPQNFEVWQAKFLKLKNKIYLVDNLHLKNIATHTNKTVAKAPLQPLGQIFVKSIENFPSVEPGSGHKKNFRISLNMFFFAHWTI